MSYGTIQEQISVVIPTLNAAAGLPATLASVAGRRRVGEIIIADGGSDDATVEIAAASGARILRAPRGRGSQLRAGAAAASGAWLLFVHADCCLATGWETAVAAFVAAPGSVACAGYFTLALDDGAAAARRVERIAAWRCRALALPYGDQGLLIARPLYDAVGGFAAIPLMEDVDLARRLGRRRLGPIAARITTSARRYQDGGYRRRPLRNLFCLSLYLAGVAPARLVRLYG